MSLGLLEGKCLMVLLSLVLLISAMFYQNLIWLCTLYYMNNQSLLYIRRVINTMIQFKIGAMPHQEVKAAAKKVLNYVQKVGYTLSISPSKMQVDSEKCVLPCWRVVQGNTMHMDITQPSQKPATVMMGLLWEKREKVILFFF